jgi:hypothetical protein
MRATISTVAFMMLVGCGGRTLLDDPNDELPLPDGGHVATGGNGQDAGSKEADAGMTGAAKCGTRACTATESCCATMSGMSLSASCIAKTATCAGATVSCTDKASCSGGDICCATLAGGIAAVFAGGTPDISVDCAKSCSGGGFQLCSTDTECPKGVTCQSTPFGESLCGGITAVLGDAGFAGLGGFGGGGGAIP